MTPSLKSMMNSIISRHNSFLNRAGVSQQLVAIDDDLLHVSLSRASRVPFQYVEPLENQLKPIANSV
jgi:hypothetical protein